MRRYFPALLGNEKTKSRIGAAIDGGTLPHALLIGGAFGSGKTTLAIEIAAALNCEKKGDGASSLPCGECGCCKRIRELNFPDLKVLSKPKDRATLGVDAIKDFREDMFLSSTESDYKIYVIDDAETMTTEAQNALLVLGYTRSEILAALRDIDLTQHEIEDIIRLALKNLMR